MAANPNRGIKIQWTSSRYIVGKDDGIRVRFDVLSACEMSDKVFAYRMLPLSVPNGSAEGHFSHVCSPVDLAEYPEDEPRACSAPEWFRLNYVDILVRSRTEAENFIEGVRGDILRLKRSLDQADDLQGVTEEQIGTVCPVDAPSESSESSVSSSESGGSWGDLESLTAPGTLESTLGSGIEWVNVGVGAGIGTLTESSESLGADVSRVTVSQGQVSKLLLIQGFDFADLPDDAKIEGISVKLRLRHQNAPTSSSSASEGGSIDCPLPPIFGDTTCPWLVFLSLHHPDLGIGTNEADSACIQGPEFAEMEFGGAGDLWNLTGWTAKRVKRGEFGVQLAVGADFNLENAIVDVTGVEITVFYRPYEV